MCDQFELELERLHQIHDARERTRAKINLLLEQIPKRIEEAEAGNTEAAAIYLSATHKILSAVLSEEENAYNRLMEQKAVSVTIEETP